MFRILLIFSAFLTPQLFPFRKCNSRKPKLELFCWKYRSNRNKAESIPSGNMGYYFAFQIVNVFKNESY